MLLIPAVDVKNGRCVRLRQGQMDAETVYSDDPLAMAQRWVEQGAPWLHVVDLDGAVEGEPRNLSIIEQIVASVPVPVQVGGGIRTIERIERYLGLGVARVIIGTLAVEQPLMAADICRRFPERIAVGLDARDGKVALKGWRQSAALDYLDVARQIDVWHPAVLIFTAIQRDGTLEGPDLPRLKELLAAVSSPVIAAGGIGNIAHIQSLAPLVAEGLHGAIIGKALYDGSITFYEALALAQGT
ncbi:MAG: 1-(5-phosphoribosyl)-5-[(5-phosphoribosylamino)methylideneamino]imidazole-4-carboxamide isomerase [Candidatus Entotheonellia bacterium]